MTPGIESLKKAGISFKIHEYTHDADSDSYGAEAAEKMGVPEDWVFKTLVVNVDRQKLVVAIVPVSSTLSLKLIAKVAGGKRAVMADKTDVQRSTGYVIGGVSPLGQKKTLESWIDNSAKELESIFISAGKRGLEIELAPDDLIKQMGGLFADIAHRSD